MSKDDVGVLQKVQTDAIEKLRREDKLANANRKLRWSIKDRILLQRLEGQFLLLPSVGCVYRRFTQYSPRICIAWLFWGLSIGVGKEF